MYRKIAMAALIGAGTVASALALPAATKSASAPSLVEKAAAWRYHDKCAWHAGRWVVVIGGKDVLCRPVRPKGAWVWHSEGGHEGWWDAKRKVWHYNNW
jgi:hypothetical protein